MVCSQIKNFKMIRPILSLVAIFAFSALTFGQANFAIKGGLNLSGFAVDKDQIDDTNMKVGYTGGVSLQLPLLDFLKIQPEVLFTAKGGKYEAEDLQVNAILKYIDIPVSAVLPIFNTGLSIHAGLQPSLLVKAKYRYESSVFGNDTVEDDDRDSYNTMDMAGIAGLAFESDRLRIEARAIRGLRNVEKDRIILTEFFDANNAKNFGLQLTAALKF